MFGGVNSILFMSGGVNSILFMSGGVNSILFMFGGFNSILFMFGGVNSLLRSGGCRGKERCGLLPWRRAWPWCTLSYQHYRPHWRLQHWKQLWIWSRKTALRPSAFEQGNLVSSVGTLPALDWPQKCKCVSCNNQCRGCCECLHWLIKAPLGEYVFSHFSS